MAQQPCPTLWPWCWETPLLTCASGAGKVRVMVSGPAPLSPSMAEFLRICIPVCQGLGSSVQHLTTCIDRKKAPLLTCTSGAGKVRVMVSGSAPLSPSVAEFLRICIPGATLLEGYGMTESTCTITTQARLLLCSCLLTEVCRCAIDAIHLLFVRVHNSK